MSSPPAGNKNSSSQALLTLAKGQAGLDRYEMCDLADLARDILATRQGAVDELRIDVDAGLRLLLLPGTGAWSGN